MKADTQPSNKKSVVKSLGCKTFIVVQPIFIKLAGIMNKRFLLDIFGILIAVLCAIVTLCYGKSWQGRYIFYMFSFLISGSLIYFAVKDFSFKKEKIQDTFLSELVLGVVADVVGRLELVSVEGAVSLVEGMFFFSFSVVVVSCVVSAVVVCRCFSSAKAELVANPR